MDDLETTVVVIGSGPTGAIAAQTLVRQGVPVTMLESGSKAVGGLVVRAFGRNILRRTKSPSSPTPYVAQGDPAPLWMHELAPGGLSNQWTCAVPRFAPSDFDEGARLDECYRWPLTYEELAPHYESVERLLRVVAGRGASAALPASASFRSVQIPAKWRAVAGRAIDRGQDLVPMPIAEGVSWQVKGGGTAFNSFTDVVLPLQAAASFSLVTGAHVLRLERERGGDVERVIYYDSEAGVERSVACKAVVVAAGPLATTKLLLNSDSSTCPEGLGNENGLVGRYLHDHAIDMAILELGSSMPRLPQPGYLTRAPYEESEPLKAAGCVLGGRISQLDRLLTFTPLPARRLGVLVFGSMVPREEKSVALDNSLKDAYGQRQLKLSIEFAPEIRQTTGKALDRLVEILDAAGLQPKITWRTPYLTPGISYHYGGTARMHRSPRYGVTNEWGRLHTVNNVVVADASVFTTGAEKNPTLTAMALAQRSAGKLAMDLKAGAIGSRAEPERIR